MPRNHGLANAQIASRSRWSSLPARYATASTATEVMIVAIGMPRAAAAARARLTRVGVLAGASPGACPGTPDPAEAESGLMWSSGGPTFS